MTRLHVSTAPALSPCHFFYSLYLWVVLHEFKTAADLRFPLYKEGVKL
jgi:hypothetical protein